MVRGVRMKKYEQLFGPVGVMAAKGVLNTLFLALSIQRPLSAPRRKVVIRTGVRMGFSKFVSSQGCDMPHWVFHVLYREADFSFVLTFEKD
jgi:hypothetical protein